MQTRIFGRTGHRSTIAIFGAVALGNVDQPAADRAMEQIIAAGVNHIDVAPSYGEAELRLGPWLKHERQRFFLGCKTTERLKPGAAAEMRQSLKRLQVDSFDLYQLHAVTKLEDLEKTLGPGGAMEAILDARDQGLTRYIGITSHGMGAPDLLMEALKRFDFDSILFPVNFIQWSFPDYRRSAQALLRECRARNVGVMAIKAIAKRPWGDRPRKYDPWYEPFDDLPHIQQAVNFTLSQDITGYCTSGDARLVPLILEACEHFTTLSDEEQESQIAQAKDYETIFQAEWA